VGPHETGDLVLAHVRAVLRAHSRDIDVAARVGGDEFVVLLPDGSSADAGAFTQRIRRALAASDQSSGLPVVHVSAGVAVEVAPTSFEPLLLSADDALYTAKRAGRNQTVTLGREEAPSAPGPTVELLGR
jgi:diguanylate cyclase (GGDEF)-like protein